MQLAQLCSFSSCCRSTGSTRKMQFTSWRGAVLSLPSSEHVKESPNPKKSNPLVLPVHRRYAVCGRSSVQRLLAQPPSEQTATPPPSSFRNLRRKAGLPSHRSSGGILSHPLCLGTTKTTHYRIILNPEFGDPGSSQLKGVPQSGHLCPRSKPDGIQNPPAPPTFSPILFGMSAGPLHSQLRLRHLIMAFFTTLFPEFVCG